MRSDRLEGTEHEHLPSRTVSFRTTVGTISLEDCRNDVTIESGKATGDEEEDSINREMNGVESLQSSIDGHRKVDQREELVRELLITEKKYVKDLDIIVEVPCSNRLKVCSYAHPLVVRSVRMQLYIRRLRENGIMEPSDIATIFSNVDQIRNLNYTLLDSLSGLTELPAEHSNVGERFLSFVRSSRFSIPRKLKHLIHHTLHFVD